MDGIHLSVLVGFVELHAAGDAGIALGRGEAVANRLCVLAPALDHICDQHDLIVSMGIQVRRARIVFSLECSDEIFGDIASVSRIELDYADVAERRFAGLLFKSEGQPNRANLDRATAAAFGNTGLGERLSNLETLPLKRVSGDHINLA